MKPIYLVIILITLAALFVAYYALIAIPKMKADCLEASTNIVSLGERSEGYRSLTAVSKGEEVVLDEYRYNQCVSIF